MNWGMCLLTRDPKSWDFSPVMWKPCSLHRLFWNPAWVFPYGSDSEECVCSVGDTGLIPVLGRSPGEGHGNPLQYSCLENPMDRGAWQATVHGIVESDLTDRLTHTHGVPIRTRVWRGLAWPFPLQLCSCAWQDSLKADRATADRHTQPKCDHRRNSPAKQLPKSSSAKSFRDKLLRVH